MTYRFAVQASSPGRLGCFDADDVSLSDAIQTVFPLEAEYALIVWNWIYVPLSYKYDLSFMAEDLIALIGAMISEPAGHRVIQWASNTFAGTWIVDWGGERTTVHATWDCVLGNTEGQLNAKPTIIVETGQFLGEWRRPLEVIVAALDAAGYTTARIASLAPMRQIVESIDHYGILYGEPAGP